MLSTAALLLFGSGTVFAAVGDESLGVNAHNGVPEFIDAAAALGVKWVRLDGNWFEHEPADDAYNWALDTPVNNAAAANLNVFITLGYTPDWVARHSDTDGQALNDPPNDASAWIDFVSDAVTHYRALGVRHFGMWNEANLQGFWEGSVAEYVDLIAVPGAAAVRAACMDCVVLGPELANVGDQADDLLEEILMRAPLSTFDIITHHTYNGFAETGWQIWDGDGFINVLDQQRFPFTRRSLRQVLDLVGWTGEVWITETGYKAMPGNNTEEANQAIYVRRAMEEQLLRAWYTNTFFYEIGDCGVDQPGCPIDGYGLMRPTAGSPGTRNFPADFRLKPAFSEIQAFIAANPAIVGTLPPVACGDGLDNDGDGRIDLADRGCMGAQDDDESNDPPRVRVDASPIFSTPAIDGVLSEVSAGDLISVDAAGWRGTEPLAGADDLAVSFAVRWDPSSLYFAFEVTDDTHDNTHPPASLWMGDSVQIAFDVSQNGGSGYDAIDDHELGVAALGGGPGFHRFHGPPSVTVSPEFYVLRSGARTFYELRVPAAALPGVIFGPASTVGFTFLVNDADGAGRVGWIEWTPGIGTSKEPELFGELVFVEVPPPPPDAGVDAGNASADAGDAAGAPDAAIESDASINADAATQPDAAIALDASKGDSTMSTSPANSGCGCTTQGSSRDHDPWIMGLVIIALLFRRARKQGPWL